MATTVERIDGYRGIWFDLGQKSEFGSKYSGGLGTYTAKHHPLAVYAPAVEKTFFVYGGTTEKDERHLLAMAAYYDHQTGQVPKPVVVHDKRDVDDPHDNPSIQIDGKGYLWVYVSGRGHKRPGHVYRSGEPYDIESFRHVSEREFTYPQPWWIEKRGFLFLFTKYTGVRELYWSVSDAEGGNWTQDRKLAGMGGHYQVSNEKDGKVITAFNMHPKGNVDQRTNLYFVQTDDGGKTWHTAAGEIVETPLTNPDCPALVRDYRSEKRLVYMKDIGFDGKGNPVILYLTSGSHQPGPKGAPRTWTIAHWTAGDWAFREITTSTHNYDMGSLYMEPDGTWRVIGPTEPGPRKHGTGGEIAVWCSQDEGKTWKKTREVTQNSPLNHGYVRRPRNAHPDFYGFWADGDPDTISESRLYFTNQAGTQIWCLPYDMEDDVAVPVTLEPGLPE
ncbi:MAG: BNR-4 repeat-containing protein [Lentisphaeria bacterium]|nr:BNR-4 repeat-containing protein [Lentisphaeria bacterium]